MLLPQRLSRARCSQGAAENCKLKLHSSRCGPNGCRVGDQGVLRSDLRRCVIASPGLPASRCSAGGCTPTSWADCRRIAVTNLPDREPAVSTNVAAERHRAGRGRSGCADQCKSCPVTPPTVNTAVDCGREWLCCLFFDWHNQERSWLLPATVQRRSNSWPRFRWRAQSQERSRP